MDSKGRSFLETPLSAGMRSFDASRSLHNALELGAPTHQVLAQLAARPEVAKEKDWRGRLPIRCALDAGAAPEVISALLYAYPNLHDALEGRISRDVLAMLIARVLFPDEVNRPSTTAKGRLEVLEVLSRPDFADGEKGRRGTFIEGDLPPSLISKTDTEETTKAKRLGIVLSSHLNFDAVLLLVKASPSSATATDSLAELPIHVALSLRAPLEVIEALLEAYPQSARIPDYERRLPLRLALERKLSAEHVSALLRAYPQALFEPHPVDHHLPLHFALDNGAPLSVVSTMIDVAPQTASIRGSHDGGRLPLRAALQRGAPPRVLVKVLLAYPPAAYDRGAGEAQTEEPTLHLAIQRTPNAYDCIRELLRASPTLVDVRNHAGELPLHIALRSKSPVEVVELLLEFGPGAIKLKNLENDLPLRAAVRGEQPSDVIFLLLSKDPDAARDFERVKVTERVVDKPLRICEDTVLHLACKHNADKSVIEALLNVWPQAAREVDVHGKLPIYYACRSANLSVDVIFTVLMQSLSSDVKTGDASPFKRCFAWTNLLRDEGDKFVSVVEMLLDQCASCAIPALANEQDETGCRAVEVATPLSKAAILRRLYLCSRYVVQEGPPLHASRDCLLLKGLDLFADGLQGSDPVPVVLKLMKNHPMFVREMGVRGIGPLASHFDAAAEDAKKKREAKRHVKVVEAEPPQSPSATSPRPPSSSSSMRAKSPPHSASSSRAKSPLPSSASPNSKPPSRSNIASARTARGASPLPPSSRSSYLSGGGGPGSASPRRKVRPLGLSTTGVIEGISSSAVWMQKESKERFVELEQFVVKIIRTHNADEDDEFRFQLGSMNLSEYKYLIVLQECDRSLDEVILRERNMPRWREEVIKIAKDLSRAVHALHERGVVHGGIRPSHIVRTKAGRYMLCDLAHCAVAIASKRETLGGKVATAWGPPELMKALKDAGGKGYGARNGPKGFDFLIQDLHRLRLTAFPSDNGASSAEVDVLYPVFEPAPISSDVQSEIDKLGEAAADLSLSSSPPSSSPPAKPKGLGLATTSVLRPVSFSFDLWGIGVCLQYAMTGVHLVQSDVFGNCANVPKELDYLAHWSDEEDRSKLLLDNDRNPSYLGRHLVGQLLFRDQKMRLSAKRVLEHPFCSGEKAVRLEGEPPEFDVFISYKAWAPMDNAVAAALFENLTYMGVKAWYDNDQLAQLEAREKERVERARADADVNGTSSSSSPVIDSKESDVLNSGDIQAKFAKLREETYFAAIAKSRIFIPIFSRESIKAENDKKEPLVGFNWDHLDQEERRPDILLLEARLALECIDRRLVEFVTPVCVGDELSFGVKEGPNARINHGPFMALPNSDNTTVSFAVEDQTERELHNAGLGKPLQDEVSVGRVWSRLWIEKKGEGSGPPATSAKIHLIDGERNRALAQIARDVTTLLGGEGMITKAKRAALALANEAEKRAKDAEIYSGGGAKGEKKTVIETAQPQPQPQPQSSPVSAKTPLAAKASSSSVTPVNSNKKIANSSK
jgi:serine/threonine protein kinase